MSHNDVPGTTRWFYGITLTSDDGKEHTVIRKADNKQLTFQLPPGLWRQSWVDQIAWQCIQAHEDLNGTPRP